MAQDSRKAELIAELARSRALGTESLHGVRGDLDFKHRLESAFRRHSIAWIVGACLAGLVLAKIPARRRKVKVKVKHRNEAEPENVAIKTGLLLTVGKLVFDVARPALTKWVSRRVSDYASDRFGRGRRA